MLNRANTGSARAFADLLQALWVPARLGAGTAGQARTLLNLRHEVGVVEHDDGGCFAVTALTESVVPAAIQPAAEGVMGHVARALHDHLRDR